MAGAIFELDHIVIRADIMDVKFDDYQVTEQQTAPPQW